MQKRISHFYSALLFASLLLILISCSRPNIDIDTGKPLPPVVKAYKHFTVAAGVAGLRDTGVYLNKNDMASILATGTMDFCATIHCPPSKKYIDRESGENKYYPMIRFPEKEQYYKFQEWAKGQLKDKFAPAQSPSTDNGGRSDAPF